MRLSYLDNALAASLRQCFQGIRCGAVPSAQYYSTGPQPAERKPATSDIAVLGGGITGLASAFYLTKKYPNAKITLYEGSSRLGGWLHSKSINIGDGNIVFEQGPRTLRPSVPNGFVTLDLIRQLDLEDEVLMTSKESVAARNRFIYYPDHLVRMPSPGSSLFKNITTILTEPVFSGLLSGAFFELAVDKRSADLEDESVGSFIERRLNKRIADNIVSAVLHGVYAGDIWQLSMKSLQPLLWHNEQRHGSMVEAAFQNYKNKKDPGSTMTRRDAELMEKLTRTPVVSDKLKGMSGASVYTFKRGIGELAEGLEDYLRENDNVKIQTNSKVNSLSYKEPNSESGACIEVMPQNHTHTHVISTLSAKHLHAAVAASHRHYGLPPLQEIHSVTVMVVNLYYSNPSLLSVHGFGYLIPRSIPYEQNPERALGVVFDSDATIGQDSVAGTKLTVMLGGHWWDDWNSYPDEEEGAAMAKRILQRHLGITEEPQMVNVGLQRECIPQYTVGHSKRMREAHMRLQVNFMGRLMVAGNSYTGVGLNDCVRAARDVVDGLDVDALDRIFGSGSGPLSVDQRNHLPTVPTGLESFVKEDQWVRARVGTRS